MPDRFDREQNKRVGRRLRELRERLGMSQLEFLAYVQERQGVSYSQSQLSRWESGHAQVGLDQVRIFGPLDPDGRGASGLIGDLDGDDHPRRRRRAP